MAVEEKIRTAQPVNRCPFCHDDVQVEEAVACRGCLARHHSGCWDEGGGCSSCSGTARLEAPRSEEVRPALTPKRATEILSAEGYAPAEIQALLRARARAQRLPGPLRFLGPPLLFAALFPVLGVLYELLGGNISTLADLFLTGLAAGTLYSLAAAAVRLKLGDSGEQ